MNYQQKVESTIKELKTKPFPGQILHGKINRTPFVLEFLTQECANDKQIISLLSRWRKKHEAWFPAMFPVTIQRTKEWYIKRLMDVPDRLLFIIRVGETCVGHVGLFRFDYKTHTCDIDNIVRGRSGNRGIMEAAIQVMMTWGVQTFDIRTYTLSTFSDNEKSCNLYKRLGFVETKRVPLIFKKTFSGGEWIETTDGPDIERYDVMMKREIQTL